jgi:hypothetical protein
MYMKKDWGLGQALGSREGGNGNGGLEALNPNLLC